MHAPGPTGRNTHARMARIERFGSPPLISLTVNGEARRFDAPMKVDALLQLLELQGKRVALERNGEIVPRSRFGDEWLADGDQIEIVVAVGGG